jgi:hypothetical protein
MLEDGTQYFVGNNNNKWGARLHKFKNCQNIKNDGQDTQYESSSDEGRITITKKSVRRVSPPSQNLLGHSERDVVYA